jgi:hypothetical protein
VKADIARTIAGVCLSLAAIGTGALGYYGIQAVLGGCS